MATVPIVTEVTKAQLDALVVASGLNEGLQYKVTDKNWLLIATSANTYNYLESTPYKSFIGLINNNVNPILDPVVTVLYDTINDVVITRQDVGSFNISGTFPLNKTFFMIANALDELDPSDLLRCNLYAENNISVITSSEGVQTDSMFKNTPIEIKVFQL